MFAILLLSTSLWASAAPPSSPGDAGTPDESCMIGGQLWKIERAIGGNSAMSETWGTENVSLGSGKSELLQIQQEFCHRSVMHGETETWLTDCVDPMTPIEVRCEADVLTVKFNDAPAVSFVFDPESGGLQLEPKLAATMRRLSRGSSAQTVKKLRTLWSTLERVAVPQTPNGGSAPFQFLALASLALAEMNRGEWSSVEQRLSDCEYDLKGHEVPEFAQACKRFALHSPR